MEAIARLCKGVARPLFPGTIQADF
ncbi:hypothetical protein TorRG33x02_123720 [Trema orientale]|uniref:Uncharacterized protein n=1 Tax=Trema orientale TaxID=63057 RepID=A0A2P5F1V4_TREOI|nr:hypothetical protein TorRG33x02_123720 [Trema orientale]